MKAKLFTRVTGNPKVEDNINAFYLLQLGGYCRFNDGNFKTSWPKRLVVFGSLFSQEFTPQILLCIGTR